MINSYVYASYDIYLLYLCYFLSFNQVSTSLKFLPQTTFMKILPKIRQPLKEVLKNTVKKLLLLLSQGATIYYKQTVFPAGCCE